MKKILLSLFVGFVGIISFCSALNVSDLIDPIISRTTATIQDGKNSVVYQVVGSDNYGTYCVKLYSSNGHGFFGMSNSQNFFTEGRSSTFFADWSYPLYICTYTNLRYLIFHADGSDITVDYELFKLNALLNTETPKLTSSECQSEYNLIPINSVDQNYCVNNNLCPGTDFYINNTYNLNYPAGYTYYFNYSDDVSFDYVDGNNEVNFNFASTGNDCPVNTGDLQWSNLYINDILHPGKPNIFVNIPDYITWDYSVGDDDFNLYVGSGYDVDYIESVIDINSYRPTSEDFTNVFVSGLTLVMPYIVIALFIIFVRKLLKRIFK